MKTVIDELEHDLSKIYENTRIAKKKLKAMRNDLDKGDFLKFNQKTNDNQFANALKLIGAESRLKKIQNKYSEHIAKLRIEFDSKFISSCKDVGLYDIKGDSMSGFSIRGILNIRIYFQKNITEIMTFTVSKKIKSLDTKIIAEKLKNEFDRLFSRAFDPNDFLSKLFKAYKHTKLNDNRPVILKEIHKILWIEQQNTGFFDTSDPKNLIIYPLDAFSVDLSKLLESGIKALDNQHFWKLSLGKGGINIYNRNGEFNAYKYIEFTKGANHA